MQHVLSKVKELGIDVQFLELEKDGYLNSRDEHDYYQSMSV